MTNLFKFKFMFLSVFFFSLLASCGEDKITPEITPNPGSDKIFNEGIHFTSGTENQTITFTTNKDWKITTAETRNGERWYNIYPTSGGPGEANVTIEVQENADYDQRSVAVTIDAGGIQKTVMISQKQKDAILVTSSRYDVKQEGETISVEVKANIQYTVSIPPTCQEWITQQATRGLSAQTLTFKIAASQEYDKREGEIIISNGTLSETVKVFQHGGSILLLNKNDITVSDLGDNITVELNSNCEYEVKMPKVNWLWENNTRGLSSHSLHLSISANPDYDARNAEIIFCDKNNTQKADTLRIHQAPKGAIILSKKEFLFNQDGANFGLEANTSLELEYVIPDSCNWIQSITTRALRLEQSYYEVTANPNFGTRRGVILVKSKTSNLTETVKIAQYGQPTSVALEQDTLRVPQTGGTYQVKIQSNVPVSLEKWAIDPNDAISEISLETSANPYKDIIFYKNKGKISLEKELTDLTLTIRVQPTSSPVLDPEIITIYGKYNNKITRLHVIQNPETGPIEFGFTDTGKEVMNVLYGKISAAMGYLQTMEAYYTQCWTTGNPNWQAYYNHTLNADNKYLNEAFKSCYEAIYLMSQIEGQEKLLKEPFMNLQAMLYAEMNILWGNVPYRASAGMSDIHYLPKKEMSDLLVSQLQLCVQNFKQQKIDSTKDIDSRTFPSSDVPRMMLARIYMDNGNFMEAANQLKVIVNSNRYTLTGSRQSALTANSSELIYAFPTESNNTYTSLIENKAILPGITYTEALLSLSECEYRIGNTVNALQYLNTIALGKGHAQAVPINYLVSLETVWKENLKGTGTYFAFLKRNGLAISKLGITQEFRLLLPIPHMQLLLDPNIIQNPGY